MNFQNIFCNEKTIFFVFSSIITKKLNVQIKIQINHKFDVKDQNQTLLNEKMSKTL
jgi:hypothetical protein